jgi:signal transduction histidine kinase
MLRRLRPKSIKHAIFYGATVGLVMLLMLAGISTYSLFRYRFAIDDFNYAVNKVPQKQALAYEFSRLFAPLDVVPKTKEGCEVQRDNFSAVLTDVEAAMADFRRKADTLPDSRHKLDAGAAVNQLLRRIEVRLPVLRARTEDLAGPKNQEARQALIGQLFPVFKQIENLPQLSERIKVPIERGQKDYESLSVTVLAITGLAVGLFFLLVYFGIRGISRPIQQVVRGARRVAQRDWNYKIEVDWPEEMAELSCVFNEMVTRFRETEEEYECQVEERSRQLVRSERLADVGFIAAGVSHEINNPLHAIMGAAESLQLRLPELTEGAPESEVAPVREYLKMIERQSERCSRITSMLKDFARKGDDSRMPTNLVNIVDEVLQLVGHLSKYRNREISFARSAAAVVDVNPSQIQQVVLNLVANALESMEAAGRLEIRIIDQIDFVVMEFEDNGCGMTQEVQSNLFEPFFTQRRSGGGTGLGLSITDRIVKDHDGTIEVASEGLGHGSLFRVRLPRRAAQSEAA